MRSGARPLVASLSDVRIALDRADSTWREACWHPSSLQHADCDVLEFDESERLRAEPQGSGREDTATVHHFAPAVETPLPLGRARRQRETGGPPAPTAVVASHPPLPWAACRACWRLTCGPCRVRDRVHRGLGQAWPQLPREREETGSPSKQSPYPCLFHRGRLFLPCEKSSRARTSGAPSSSVL